jgi:phosphorylcholine metabolism protein LicD
VAMLGEFYGWCRSLEVRPILMHGGLLGWYWNQRLLPWDGDLDLCVFYSDLFRLSDGLLAGQPPWQECYLLDVNPHHVDRRTLNRTYREWTEPNRIDARFIDRQNGLYIDITALSKTGDKTFITKCPHSYEEEDLLPLQDTEIEGVPVFVPRNVPWVLTKEYGHTAVELPFYRNYFFDRDLRIWVARKS